MGMPPKYTREELLKLGKEVGHITSQEWERRGDLCTMLPIRRIFGSWRNFRFALLEEEKGKEEAERIKAAIPQRGQKPLYTKEDLLRYAAGVWPIRSDVWHEREDLPSIGPVNRIFGNWTNFKQEVEKYLANPDAATLGESLSGKKEYDSRNKITYQKTGILRKRIEDPVIKSRLEETINEFVASGDFNQDRHAIYRMAQKARECLGSDSITVSDVREQVRSSSKELFSFWSHRVYTTLENFLTVETYLNKRKLKELERYGHRAGVYLLASDLKEDEIDIHPKTLSCLIEDKKALEDLVGEKASKIKKWKPRSIDLNFEQATIVINTLKDIYEMGSDFFFERYGSSLGILDLATDIEENGYKEEFINRNWKDIHTFIGDGEVVSALLGVDDPRFQTDWKPRTIFLNGRQADIIIPHLGKRYEQNSDTFFKVYGSELGAVILAKELQQVHGLSISPGRLHSLISNGRDMEKILDVEDKRFRGEWKPRNVQVTLDHLETLTTFFKEQYEKDSASFFSKYGSEIGAITLMEDLEQEKKVKINPSVLQSIVGKGSLVEILLGIKDERFTLWNQKRMAGDKNIIDMTNNFLHESYNADSTEFFNRYGTPEGMYHLAVDLKERGWKKRININDLCDIVGTSSKVTKLADLKDEQFEEKWNPRRFNLYLDTFEGIVDVLRKEYQRNSDAFFSNYGSQIGTYRLAKKLNKEGIKITHLTTLGTIVNKGEVISKLLGIEDERFKQPQYWKPRAIQAKLQDLEKILDFMRDKYNEEDNKFFKRYGAKEGQITLSRDLEQAFQKKVGYINRIMGDGKTLSKLLEIDDSRFTTDWNSKGVMNANQDRIELVLDLLREKYQQDSDGFFSLYGRRSGIIDVARTLYKEKRIDVQLSNITTLVQDGEKLAASLKMKDKRFGTEWKPGGIDGKFSDVEATLTYLKKQFVLDHGEFFRNYGSTDGIVSLLSDIELQGEGVTNPAHISQLLTKEVLAEQLGINIEQFDVDFKPKKTSFNKKSFNKVLEKLKQQYHLDGDLFFNIYGSRLGAMILAEETNLSAGARHQVGWFLSRRTDFEGLLEIEDERFKTRWLPKLSPELEKVAMNGLKYLAEGRKLPEIDEPITEELKEYLNFRYNILRGTSKGFADQGLASVYKSANKETVLYFAKIFAPQTIKAVEEFVEFSIEEDRKILSETTLDSIAGSGRTYTKEKLIEIGKKAGITSSTEWQKTSGLPPYVTIFKYFGGWGQFQEAINNNDLIEPRASEKITYGKSLSTDEFCLRAGRLLYSFDSEVRLKAVGLLLDFGTRSHVYQESKNKGSAVASVANELLESSVVRYDPYKLFVYNKNKLLPLLAWVGGNVKYAETILNQKNGINVSIERGGYESEKLYGGNAGIRELA